MDRTERGKAQLEKLMERFKKLYDQEFYGKVELKYEEGMVKQLLETRSIKI